MARAAQKQFDLLDLDVKKKQLDLEGQNAEACEPLSHRKTSPTCMVNVQSDPRRCVERGQ